MCEEIPQGGRLPGQVRSTAPALFQPAQRQRNPDRRPRCSRDDEKAVEDAETPEVNLLPLKQKRPGLLLTDFVIEVWR